MATILGLTMKIAANTAGISQGAKQTAKQLEHIQTSAKQAASAMRTMVAIKVGELFSKAVSSISGFVSGIRESVGELTKLAQISNTTVERFQGLAIAASSVGIEQDKLADIFKDVGDRVGDFLQTGGGPMADFFQNIAPKVGVTAEQFARLSGPEALQLYVDSLQKAGLSQAEMTFYLEAMSSDLTALLPLLQNGGAGFENLAERAKRLGIVLSEDQTSAIKEMNAALGLVYATFEGIIGQVTANLAPVVTSIAEEFLQFVEGYKGLGEGTGGTALADSITDALFDGAELLAGILDGAVSAFADFGASMEMVSAVFEFVANVFVAVAETLRGIFNIFEMIGNALLFGLGRVLQGIGSWVSSDLENAGKEIARSASEGMRKNGAEAGDAFVHAANAALGDRNYGRGEGDSGMFSDAVRDARKAFDKGAKQQEDAAAETQAAAKAQEDAFANIPVKESVEIIGTSQESIEKAQRDYAKRSAEIEKARLEELSKVNQKALEAADVRAGGISQFLALATGREDPAVTEARKQVDELRGLRNDVKALGGTVEIAGAA